MRALIYHLRIKRMILPAALAALCATCDASRAVAPPYVEPVVMSFSGDTMVVVGSTVAPTVTAELGGEPVTNARFRFISADTSILAMTPRQDSIAGRRRGCTILTIRLENSLLGANAPSLAQRMCAVVAELTPDPSSLIFESIGATATLRISAVDGAGQPMPAVPVQWESADTTIAGVSTDGRVTARGAGSAEIRATVDNVTVAIPVSVAQRLVRFTFSPSSVVLDAFSAETTTVATGRDSLGYAVPTTVEIWESRDTNFVAVSATGLMAARANGVTYVLGRRDAVVDSLRVEVRQKATSVVISSVSGLAINSLGDELLLSGRGFDRLNHAILDLAPTWTSLAPAVAEVLPDRGLVSGLSIGSADIVASLDGVRDTATVTVDNVPVSLEILPNGATLTSLGDQVTLSVIALNGRGASIPDPPIAWSATNLQVISLSAAGEVTAIEVGQSAVIAVTGDIADTIQITVENKPASLSIIPDAHTFPYLGDTLSPAVDIRNARGDPLPRTSVTWTSEDPTIASVTTNGGVITARAAGETYVRASYESLRDSLLITVQNYPASLELDATLDTLTALGQELTYTATVRNARGDLMTDEPEWRSTNTAVATVTASGTMTGVGYGTAQIIASADPVADTVVVVVVNPRTIHVDNSVVVSPRFGTRKRPFGSVQHGVDMADAFDTVLVQPGASPYSETVALIRRVTLLGDSSAFVTSGRDPLRLPVISHDTGTAAIIVDVRAPVTIRYMAVLHSVDGPAIDVYEADAILEYVYVNPGVTGLRIGRGILLRNVINSASIRNSAVTAVSGYGLRMDNVRNGRVTGVELTAIGAWAGESGAGIHVSGGEGNLVELSRIRGTAGPHILSESSSGLRVSDNDLAGRHQVIRLVGATGATEISRNTLDLSRQPEDPGVAGSETDGRSGLEIRSSSGVTVLGNTFREPGTSLMDAIRLIDSRAPGGAAVLLQENVFHRGRHHVRSEQSSWSMVRSRSDSAVLPISATNADTITLVDDTLRAVVGGRCLVVTGAASAAVVSRGLFEQCSPSTVSVGEPAISVIATNSSLDVTGTRFVGQHQTAIRFSGRRLSVRSSAVRRTQPGTATSFSASGVIDATGDTISVAGTSIAGHAMLPGLSVNGGAIQLDSNRVTRNATGVRVGAWVSIRLLDNDVFDNSLAGLVNATSSGMSAPGNWWGDGLGPRRSEEPTAVGDSIIGNATVDPFRTDPLTPGAGTAELLKVRGDGQSAARGDILPLPLTVRVLDGEGRPVAGVAVTFEVTNNNSLFVAPSSGSTIVVTSDASGLARATLRLGNSNEPTVVEVRAAGATSVTFTATPL
ncbi:MAG TPA: Ig-like domain-containing protein [Gemmatimonadaceae bacterium]|nr:Ig-like domain-containing protein [Gemmatimonadaceae bacterium]